MQTGRHIPMERDPLNDPVSGEPEQEADLFVHHEWAVDPGQEPLRIDKYLMNRLENVSRTRIQAAAHAGNILINGRAVKPNHRVKPGELLQVVLSNPPREFVVAAENIPLDVVYEDEHLAVVNKPAGMVVHPGVGNRSGTLVNALAFRYGDLPLRDDGEPARPGLVHRLDKDTSGLMVVALSELALNHLARQFYERTASRKYIALVWGDLEGEGTIEGNIGRDLRHRQRMAVFPEGDHGKPAFTSYRVLERLGYVTLVECRLQTGRTHQIRVHFAWKEHPVFNDPTYGGDKIVKGTVFSRYRSFAEGAMRHLPGQALHAVSLGFRHPVSLQELHFETGLSQGFAGLLDDWRSYIHGLKST